jgi:phosphoserine phosphatase RsbX
VPDGGTAGPYDWAVAEQTLEGQRESGDRALIAPRPDGTLVAVVDGLVHGEEAAGAARRALDTLAAHVGDDLAALVQHCHAALRRTRGAVMALALLRADGTVSWAGVGNVEAVAVRTDGRARDHALLLGGVLGMQIPTIRASEVVLAPGDEVVLATDGISRNFVDELRVGPPRRTADELLRRYAHGRDDALVLVVRYNGEGR